ncbi:hypothetical protein LJC45_06015 [Alistipes sp. OttesenSCG-928-B03]|nr:hypothetical protein [Alistipes sp. OttesenSCG-928-B03]
MKSIKPLVIAAALAVGTIFPACVKKDIHDSSDAGKGTVEFSVSWGTAGTGVTTPSAYTLLFNNATKELTDSKYVYPEPLEPKLYTAIFYTAADKITTTNGIATLATEGGYVAPDPGWFFGGSRRVMVVSKEKAEAEVQLNQHVGELRVSVSIDGAFDRITSAYFEVDNVAGKLDLSDMSYSTPSKVMGQLQKNADNNKLEGSVRLLGIIPSATKTISLLVSVTGESMPIEFSADVSSQINDFNSKKVEGKTITNALTIPYEVGGTATIGTWLEKNEGTIIIGEE